MSNVMKCQISWNVKCHEMSNVMKCQMTWYVIIHEMSWNIKCHKMSNVMIWQMSWNVKCHKISNIMKCKMSGKVKCHEILMLMLDIWPQAETSRVTHFGAYHRPPDGNFLCRRSGNKYFSVQFCGGLRSSRNIKGGQTGTLFGQDSKG